MAGSFASAWRSANVRCAVSSVMSRSGNGLMASSSSSSGSPGAPPTVMTARRNGTSGFRPVGGSTANDGFDLAIDGNGRFVFRPDIAAIDRQHTFVIDADEDAGAGDIGGIVDYCSRFEGGQPRLDLPEPLIDLVRQFVGLGVIGLQLVV